MMMIIMIIMMIDNKYILIRIVYELNMYGVKIVFNGICIIKIIF